MSRVRASVAVGPEPPAAPTPPAVPVPDADPPDGAGERPAGKTRREG